MSLILTYATQNDLAFVFDPSGTVTGADTDTDQLGLSDTTTPPVTKGGKFQVALGGGGTATIDLTAVTTLDGRTVDLTGLKVRTWKATRPATDANDLTIGIGGSNPYRGFGSTYSETVHAGGEVLRFDGGSGSGVAVDSTRKTFDLTGTAGESLVISFTAGA